MSKIALEGNASGTGTFTIAGPNTNTNYTITLPQETGTLVTTGVTTGLNGSAITTGTVAASVGGTGLTSAGTNGNVLTSNGTAWVSQAISAGGDYIMNAYTTPATWTKPAGLKAVKVTVIGAGGNGGSGSSACPPSSGGNGGGGGGAILYADAPAIPGPVAVTVGTAPSKTSSFGALVSATGGTNGSGAPAPTGPYAGGTGSGGTVNVTGESGWGAALNTGARAGAAAFGMGAGITGPVSATAGLNYGGGGMGRIGSPSAGGAGAQGIVIVEEFY